MLILWAAVRCSSSSPCPVGAAVHMHLENDFTCVKETCAFPVEEGWKRSKHRRMRWRTRLFFNKLFRSQTRDRMTLGSHTDCRELPAAVPNLGSFFFLGRPAPLCTEDSALLYLYPVETAPARRKIGRYAGLQWSSNATSDYRSSMHSSTVHHLPVRRTPTPNPSRPHGFSFAHFSPFSMLPFKSTKHLSSKPCS